MVKCLLCQCEVEPSTNGFYTHPEADDCLVKLTDLFGISVEPENIFKSESESNTFSVEGIDIKMYPFVDEVLTEIFHAHGIERLGGASTGRGWSSFSLFQKCPYAWKRRYLEKAKPLFSIESQALAVGSLFHAYLAVMYTKAICDDYPLTPDLLHQQVMLKANPEYAQEAWRIFVAYRLFYQYDTFIPLAIELDLKDPRTNESCRYDLVAYFPDESPMRSPGTFIIETKTASRFDRATLDGWSNNGEVLGQVMLWERLGLDKRFGKLSGVIMNIAGRQKEPQFHRTIISPSSWQIEQHKEDLKRWEGAMHLAQATDNFPRSRHSCIDRYGFCEWWDHCSSGQ